MALTLRRYKGKGVVRTQLMACPLCGHQFGSHEQRWKHFLNEHNPEDAGLSPIGETPPEVFEPLFGLRRREQEWLA